MTNNELHRLLEVHTDAWNSHDLTALMGLFSPDCVFEASGGGAVCGQRYEGSQAVSNAFAAVFEAMPDAQWGGGRHYVLGPEYGVSEWVLTGTLADGRRIETNGCDFLSFREGKIIRKNSFRKQ